MNKDDFVVGKKYRSTNWPGGEWVEVVCLGQYNFIGISNSGAYTVFLLDGGEWEKYKKPGNLNSKIDGLLSGLGDIREALENIKEDK